MAYLSEDLFDDIVQSEVPAVEMEPVDVNDLTPKGPAAGADTGVANLIHDLLIDENEAVENYNNAIASLESRPELIPIMQDIVNEEMNHIGMLEVALELVSPNAKSTDEGEAEAEEVLAKSESEVEPENVDESLEEDYEHSGMSIIIQNKNGLATVEAFKVSGPNGDYYNFENVAADMRFSGNLPTHNAMLALMKEKGQDLLAVKLRGITKTTPELINCDVANVELINITDVSKLISPQELEMYGCGGNGETTLHEVFVNGYSSKRAYNKSFEDEQAVVSEYLAQGKSVIQYTNYVNPQGKWIPKGGPRARREGAIDCGKGVTMESLQEK